MGGWHCALPSALQLEPSRNPQGHTWASQAAAWAPRTPLFPLASGSGGWRLEVVPELAEASQSGDAVGHTCVGLPGLDELLEQLLGDGAARPVVLRHPEQRLLLPHPVLQHL